MVDPDLPELTENVLNEANAVLEKPFSFYGGYV